jgi:hypothetical protein
VLTLDEALLDRERLDSEFKTPTAETGGQADSSEDRQPCLVCGLSLFADQLAARVCEHCARSLAGA